MEIMKEVAKRLNLKVEFTEMGVDGMLTALDEWYDRYRKLLN